MKIRNGFVSNSSSTSFCIIGTENDEDIQRLLKYFGIPNDDCFSYGNYGVSTKSFPELCFYGNYNLGEAWAIGVDAESLLNTMTIPKAIEYFKNCIEEDTGIKLNGGSFSYGEAGD